MKSMFHFSKIALVIAISASLATGCNDDSDDNKALDLTILHINDHHSHLNQDDIKVTLGADEYEFESGGFPRVVTAFKELQANASYANVLKLHAGDAMTGTLFYTLFEGEADAAMMNEVCFDAFALGNHEFDASDAGLKKFLDYLNPDSNAACPETPVLAANITPAVGTPLAPNAADDYIKPYVIKEFDGEKVGIVGIDIKNKTQNSSSPLITTQFADELTTAQAMIDELKDKGINKVILLTHYQYDNDKALAAALDGVDVIVGGDSHSLLGDFANLGLNSAGSYPTEVLDKAGNPVCIVQAWQYAQVVGELNVSLDKDGVVTACNGTPHLLVENPIEKNGEDISHDSAAIEAANALAEASPNLRITSADTSATATLASFEQQVSQLEQAVIGEAATDLCLERVPGQGKGSLCSAEETKPHGGDIQMLVAHAFRNMSLTSDIAIQNAGGVRIDVPAGDVTIGTAYTLLPFSNTLVELEMTGQQIKEVLEEAIDYATSPDGSTGAYPYAAGLRWDADLSQSKGSRLSSIEYKGRNASVWTAFDTAATYKVVTNNYIAAGRDGYLTFATITGDNYVDTYLDYAQSFADYTSQQADEGKMLEKLPYSEYSTQNFTDADGNFFATKAQ